MLLLVSASAVCKTRRFDFLSGTYLLALCKSFSYLKLRYLQTFLRFLLLFTFLLYLPCVCRFCTRENKSWGCLGRDKISWDRGKLGPSKWCSFDDNPAISQMKLILLSCVMFCPLKGYFGVRKHITCCTISGSLFHHIYLLSALRTIEPCGCWSKKFFDTGRDVFWLKEL